MNDKFETTPGRDCDCGFDIQSYELVLPTEPSGYTCDVCAIDAEIGLAVAAKVANDLGIADQVTRVTVSPNPHSRVYFNPQTGERVDFTGHTIN